MSRSCASLTYQQPLRFEPRTRMSLSIHVPCPNGQPSRSNQKEEQTGRRRECDLPPQSPSLFQTPRRLEGASSLRPGSRLHTEVMISYGFLFGRASSCFSRTTGQKPQNDKFCIRKEMVLATVTGGDVFVWEAFLTLRNGNKVATTSSQSFPCCAWRRQTKLVVSDGKSCPARS